MKQPLNEEAQEARVADRKGLTSSHMQEKNALGYKNVESFVGEDLVADSWFNKEYIGT